MPPAQAGTALAERAGEAGHHERDRGAVGHPHRSTTPRSRMEGHTTVPELGHGSPLRLENGIGVGRRWSARRVSGGGALTLSSLRTLDIEARRQARRLRVSLPGPWKNQARPTATGTWTRHWR